MVVRSTSCSPSGVRAYLPTIHQIHPVTPCLLEWQPRNERYRALVPLHDPERMSVRLPSDQDASVVTHDVGDFHRDATGLVTELR